jgi:UDP-glucose 4-epimerase
LNSMKRYRCTNLIYSSSATVYGNSPAPVDESSQVGQGLTCNYAYNKYDMENYLIENFSNLDDWKVVILRYFNPIGAHPSGLIGEDPNDVPNNIFPYLLRVAKQANEDNHHQSGPYDFFTIFGNDYNTSDGTCIRDYIHVQDLARAHVDVLKINNSNTRHNTKSIQIFNVGTGKGTSVLCLINTINKVLLDRSKQPIVFKIGERRQGDLDVSYADASKIYKEIGFKTELDVNQMCVDGLNFVGL